MKFVEEKKAPLSVIPAPHLKAAVKRAREVLASEHVDLAAILADLAREEGRAPVPGGAERLLEYLMVAERLIARADLRSCAEIVAGGKS